MKNKKNSIAKNTVKKQLSKLSSSVTFDEVEYMIQHIEYILYDEELSYEVRKNIINEFVDIYNLQGYEIPQRLINAELTLFINLLVDTYQNNKMLFFEAFSKMIDYDVDQAYSFYKSLEENFEKEDSERLEQLFEAKKTV